MATAAAAPKANAPDRWQIAVEVLVIVAVPLTVPTAILWLSRSAIDLSDVSFGFVALAMAATTKSLAVRTPAWTFTGILSMVLTTICVGVAVSTDPYKWVRRVLNIAGAGPVQIVNQSGEIDRLMVEVVNASPTQWHWGVVIVFGVILAGATLYLILKGER